MISRVYCLSLTHIDSQIDNTYAPNSDFPALGLLLMSNYKINNRNKTKVIGITYEEKKETWKQIKDEFSTPTESISARFCRCDSSQGSAFQ